MKHVHSFILNGSAPRSVESRLSMLLQSNEQSERNCHGAANRNRSGATAAEAEILATAQTLLCLDLSAVIRFVADL